MSTQSPAHVAFSPRRVGAMVLRHWYLLSSSWPRVLDLISGHKVVWENEPMEQLARRGQLAAWVHQGFWQPMDTLRDKQNLNALWDQGAAPWKVWEG